jgi:hypothetical protein
MCGIDFFRSIGRLPLPTLYSQWYASESGEISICAAEMRANEEEWRSQYWKDFPNTISTKLDEWSYEEERRLVLFSIAHGCFEDVNNRKLKYDFSDLSGIIFGMGTKLEDKVKIIKIIKEKCVKYGRRDFDFYQAFYNRDTGKIEVNLLKNLLGLTDEPALIKQ